MVTVAGFATVVWFSRLAARIPRPRKIWLAFTLLALYAATVALHPSAWLVIDMAELAGAVGGVILVEGALQSQRAVAVFLTTAAVADAVSMAGGISKTLIDGFRGGSSHALEYLALLVPVHGSVAAIIGITDLFLTGTAAVALMRLKLGRVAVFGTVVCGLLTALATGLWLGPMPAIPFVAAAAWILLTVQAPTSLFRHRRRSVDRSGVKYP